MPVGHVVGIPVCLMVPGEAGMDPDQRLWCSPVGEPVSGLTSCWADRAGLSPLGCPRCSVFKWTRFSESRVLIAACLQRSGRGAEPQKAQTMRPKAKNTKKPRPALRSRSLASWAIGGLGIASGASSFFLNGTRLVVCLVVIPLALAFLATAYVLLFTGTVVQRRRGAKLLLEYLLRPRR